jgi:ketosteroid isomerase-like protein
MKVRSILIIVFFISACHAPQEGTDMAVTKIERMSADRAAAFNEGDAARIAQHFSEDGLLMAPDSETLTGRNAVEGY